LDAKFNQLIASSFVDESASAASASSGEKIVLALCFNLRLLEPNFEARLDIFRESSTFSALLCSLFIYAFCLLYASISILVSSAADDARVKVEAVKLCDEPDIMVD
jgi:hypothetical protein